ncbi:MAG: NADH-quinone oxidoreductase subunit C [Candidatus Fermentibacteraceae bacterium]
MTREQVLRDLGSRFGDDILGIFDKSPKRVFINLKPRAIAWVAPYIFRELGARFNIATGTDTPDGIEILYHFTLEDLNLMLNIRVLLDRDNPVIVSLGKHIEAVNWIEREMKELLGITFEGHPDPRRLLLPDNWPDGVYPLRQDYSEWDETAIRTRGL